ncbi:T-cell immunomodulatory protein [Anoplolepis gracilipes]|uniref:T-cell immunomodulatory protein n=1 Tax=Anoplolepis gracilipes TaxID=354296 RepID=UPI003BA2C9D2
MLPIRTLVLLVALVTVARCSDITPAVFGNVLDGMPAAFGDFNSDELTDVFMLRGKLEDNLTVEVFLAADQEPLLRPAPHLNCSFKERVTSVVPGDFDGDVFMDILVTTFNKTEKLTHVHILWGGNGHLNCSDESFPPIKMHDQPLALDYNQDMIIDLFGVDENGKRVFWIFKENRHAPQKIYMDRIESDLPLEPVRHPHSNAFLDLNSDFLSDLVVTTNKSFEIWLGTEQGFQFSHRIYLPYNISFDSDFKGEFGQTLYLDVELTGKMALLLPLCFNEACTNCTIMMYQNGWHNLRVNFRDPSNVLWGFVKPDGKRYTETITLRGGDFNMDGYPDLLATLQSSTGKHSFLLQNVACKNCAGFNRTFEIKWQALNPFFNETAMAVFYDFYQDGILDVILVEFDKTSSNPYRTAAFKNSLDYDANFVKVMVLTGRTNSMYPISPGSLGKKKRTYGTNLPGPSIAYRTTTQDGSPRNAIAAQLPQSAHFSLNLPYTTFGLGRTPNFVDALTIGVGGKSREWPQIIPNSQMVVIPNPIAEPSRWKAQLFVTPSKLILLSAAALTGTCGLITAIILGLYWKERREDKIERLQEAHRFHFDAM